MKRKIVISLTIIGLLIGGYAGKTYGEMNIMNRTYSQLEESQVLNIKDEENQQAIAKGVLEDTGRTDLYDLNDLQQVDVYFGNITPDDEKDVIVTVSFGPLNTVVATYTKEGDTYTYVGDVGNFYEVKNVSFVPIESLGQDVIIITEFANQNIGAYETSEFLEGFLFEDNEFRRVLKTPTFIEASWNESLEDSENGDPNFWKKVSQTSDDTWEKEPEIALDLVRYQNYYTSHDGDISNIPKDNTFEKVAQRVVKERFVWSDKWSYFILGEGVEKSTNSEIAILEDRDTYPYALAGYVENSYLIQREDGTTDILKAEEIVW